MTPSTDLPSAEVREVDAPFPAQAHEAIYVLNGAIIHQTRHASGAVLWGASGTWTPSGTLVRVLTIPLPSDCVAKILDTDTDFLQARHGRPVHVASKLASEITDNLPASREVQVGLQWELAGYLVRLAILSTRSVPAWLDDAVKLIEAKLAESLSLPELAEHLQIPPRRVSEAISQHYGSSFREFVLRKRLDAACRLLLRTNLSVGEIAHQTGFADHAHMTREFRRIIGVPPSEYAGRD